MGWCGGVKIQAIFIVCALFWRAGAELNHGLTSADSSSFEILAEISSQHPIVQRQSCEPDSVEQRRRVAAAQCDTNYVTAVTASECDVSFFSNAEDIRRCGTDRGTLCALYSPSLTTTDRDIVDRAQDVQHFCFEEASLSKSLANCSAECRNALEAFGSDFGCCVRSEPQFSQDDLAKTLTPLLWSQCGVTLPEPCEDTPLESPAATTSCGFFCGFSVFIGLECRHVGSKLLEIYEDCGDTGSANELRQQCGFNQKGQSCGLSLDFITTQRDTVFSTYNKCYRFLSARECAPECRGALESLKNKFGCCVNNLNTTSAISSQEEIGAFVTSYELWSACDVESPGFCSLADDVSLYDDLIQCELCHDY